MSACVWVTTSIERKKRNATNIVVVVILKLRAKERERVREKYTQTNEKRHLHQILKRDKSSVERASVLLVIDEKASNIRDNQMHHRRADTRHRHQNLLVDRYPCRVQWSLMGLVLKEKRRTISGINRYGVDLQLNSMGFCSLTVSFSVRIWSDCSSLSTLQKRTETFVVIVLLNRRHSYLGDIFSHDLNHVGHGKVHDVVTPG